MGSGILRAVGDSRHPLLYLAVASIVNIILDFTFVWGFTMGIAGVAIATIMCPGSELIHGHAQADGIPVRITKVEICKIRFQKK